MQGFLDENGFKAMGDDFASETAKISVKYDDEKQTYSLYYASKNEDGEFGELEVINSWLFDDTQTAKDAEAVGMDFLNSLRKSLGIKKSRANNIIDLPTASKNGGIDIQGFTKKMLDVFPNLKEDYKEHISVYGNFLYLNFFGEKLVPLLTEAFVKANKKSVKKLYDVFEDVYVKGDKDTVNVMIAVLSASGYKNDAATATIRKMLADNNHFLQAFDNFSGVLAGSKKLLNALVKN